jgi:hypothetical protein
VAGKYPYKRVNLTKDAEKLLNDVEALLGRQYSRPEIVEAALMLLYHVLRKRGYKSVAELLQHVNELG